MSCVFPLPFSACCVAICLSAQTIQCGVVSVNFILSHYALVDIMPDIFGIICINSNTKIKKMLLGPYPGDMVHPATHFFVASKCVSVCIAADTALSKTNFINLIMLFITCKRLAQWHHSNL